MKRRSTVTTVSLYVVGTLYGVAVLFPIVWMLMLALKSQLDAFAKPPLLIFEPTLVHFIAIFQDKEFLQSIVNSLIISTGSVLSAMLFAIPATFALTIMQGRVRRNALLTILLIRTAPGMIYLLPYFVVYSRLGMLDTHCVADHHLSHFQCAADYLDSDAGLDRRAQGIARIGYD